LLIYFRQNLYFFKFQSYAAKFRFVAILDWLTFVLWNVRENNFFCLTFEKVFIFSTFSPVANFPFVALIDLQQCPHCTFIIYVITSDNCGCGYQINVYLFFHEKSTLLASSE